MTDRSAPPAHGTDKPLHKENPSEKEAPARKAPTIGKSPSRRVPAKKVSPPKTPVKQRASTSRRSNVKTTDNTSTTGTSKSGKSGAAPKPATSRTIAVPNVQPVVQEPTLTSIPDPAKAGIGIKQEEPQHETPAALPALPAIDDDALHNRLMAMHQEIRSLRIPVIILFEGWDAAGKGTALGELLEGLGPRGYKVHVIDKPTAEERRYPPNRRYWTAMPADGQISLFVGGWYREVSGACLSDKNEDLAGQYARILQMESQLVCNGALLLKFFFNISQKEQKSRFKTLEAKKSTRWRVTKDSWEQNKRYDEMMHLYDAMISHTDFSGAAWHVLRSGDKRACKTQLFDIILDAFEKSINARKTGDQSWDTPIVPQVEPIPTAPVCLLGQAEPNQPEVVDYKSAIDRAQRKLQKLQLELYRKKIPLVIAFEGWDAAGKGGCIRRLTSALDPRGFEVIPIAAPTPEQKAHHHIWRFWSSLPKDGHIAIFDRSWYGRVLVERIEGFCTQSQWQRAYEEINQFEWDLCAHGGIVRKFWLQIDQEEQLIRFRNRESALDKQWKITEEDWRNREKWPLYETAANDMLQRTHTHHAPWIIVEANNKRFARLKVLHTLAEAIEQRIRKG